VPAVQAPPPPDRLLLAPVAFAALPGWRDDRHAEALASFRRSCPVLLALPPEQPIDPDRVGGPAAPWQAACRAADAVPAGDDRAARDFFEQAFLAFAATNGEEAEGLFTGYYEPDLKGARQRAPGYEVPLYRRPPDLIGVDLGRFRPAWRGQRIGGRVEAGALVPYASRAEIAAGALAGRGLELLFLADPVDAFFLQIQGSGRVVLPDGGIVRVGYDGQNGHPYVAIGRLLVERGVMAREEVSLESLRQWLRAHPEDGRHLMNENPSYVFFRELTGEGPIGTQGVVLTAGRSLAVDRQFVPLGVPVWLDAEDNSEPAGRLRRLLVAQDTGGAIAGPVRGDVFWGQGEAAERHAGGMRARGRWWLLLPRGGGPP
jgi:membrane-bound lytic murein transglycosylase A